MHASVLPLKRTLDLNTRLFVNCLDGVSDEMALKRSEGSNNPMAFLAVHVLDARYYLARSAGLEIENPFKEALEGAKSADDIEEYPRLDSVRDAWKDVSEKLSGRLEGLTETDLEAEAPYDFPIEGGKSILGMMTFLTQHDTYHVGQMAFLRRALGLEAMSYQ